MLSFILDNTVLKVICLIIFIVWAVEVFLLPFKLNRYFTRHKELCSRMERIENFLREICSDSKNLKSIEKFSKLAFGLTSKKVFVDEKKNKKEDHP